MQASARLSSSAASRKVISGVSSATTRSCYRTSRGKAHAAPLPAQEPAPKGRKRITKQERRVKIVEFIENYRASNDGKFPTITNIREQIGGCYYTVRHVFQEMKYNHAKLPQDNRKLASLQVTKVSEHSMTKDDAEVAQSQGTVEVSKHSSKDEGNPDPGNQQREIEANKFDLKNSEKPLNANDSNASDQNGSDMLNEAKTHAREDNPKLEESANTGLLGSLKSFAYGIRNFWKNM